MERSPPPLKHIAVVLIIGSITFMSVGGGITLSNMLSPLPDFSTMPFQDGMSFTTFGVASYNSTAAEAEILKMKAIGVEWVAVNSWWFQDNLTATVIHNGTWSDSPENLSAFFQFIRAQGMHVMFKPMVDSLDGLWRSNINASPAWLVEYERFLNMTASIAQAGGADILCVGTEMGSWQVHTAAVRHALWSVKQIYSGKLTYSANHDSFWYIDWWDDVDYIGISWYPPFTMSYNPTLDDLIVVWNAFYDPLYQFARKYGKPILLTEIGAQARDGTNMVPNDDKFSSKQDIGELVMMYQALFQSKVWSASWFKGAYWWMWYIGDPDPTGFSPNLPQVEAVIQQAYAQPPEDVPPSNLLPAIALLAGIICLPVAVLAWVRESKTQPNPLDGDDKIKKTQLQKWVILTGVNFGLLASWAGFFYNEATFQTIYAAYSQSQFLGTNPLTIYVGIGLTALGAILLGAVLAKIATRTRKSATPAAGTLPIIAGCLSLAVFAGFWGINLRSFSPVLVLAVLALAAWAASTGSFLVLHAPPAKRADMARGALGIVIVGGAVITGISLLGILSIDAGGIAIAIGGFCVAPFVLVFTRQPPALKQGELPETADNTRDQIRRIILADLPYPPYPAEYQRASPTLRDRLRPSPGRTIATLSILCAFAAFIVIPSFIKPFILINFNLGLVDEYYVILGPAIAIGGIIGYGLLRLAEKRPQINSFLYEEPTAASLLMLIVAGLVGAACVIIVLGFPEVPPLGIALFAGGVPIGFAFGSLVLNELRLTDSNEPASRATRAFSALAVLFTIGFTANGIKAAFIYLFTFLEFVNGQLVVRTNFTTTLNWDVPGFVILLFLIIGLVLLLLVALIGYLNLRRVLKYHMQGATSS